MGNEVVSKTAVVAGLVSDANDSGVINLSSKVAGNVKAMGAAGSTLSTGVAAIETINAVQNGYTTGAIQGGSDTIAGAVGFIPIPGARVFSGAYAVGRFLDDLSGASKFYGDLLSP